VVLELLYARDRQTEIHGEACRLGILATVLCKHARNVTFPWNPIIRRFKKII
jgi:hypothetical protein